MTGVIQWGGSVVRSENEGSLSHIDNSLIVKGSVDIEVLGDMDINHDSTRVMEWKAGVTGVEDMIVLHRGRVDVEVGIGVVVEATSLVKGDTRHGWVIDVSSVDNGNVFDILDTSSVEVTDAVIVENDLIVGVGCRTDWSSNSTPNEWVRNNDLST